MAAVVVLALGLVIAATGALGGSPNGSGGGPGLPSSPPVGSREPVALGVGPSPSGGPPSAPGSDPVSSTPTAPPSARTTGQPSTGRSGDPAGSATLPPRSSAPSLAPSVPTPPVANPTDPTSTPPSGSAPTTADGFKMLRTVVPMGFPLEASVSYRYRQSFKEPRDGPPEWYNHVRGRSPNGTLLRGHDGIDLYAAKGTPVLSPFDGVVIEPRERWDPWHGEWYGVTVVIQSEELTSAGYVTFLSHLSRRTVEPGERVVRGEMVGRLGKSGNAVNQLPQLHFELRAPFMIEVKEAGRKRRLDVFDPFPSVRAADPKRQ